MGTKNFLTDALVVAKRREVKRMDWESEMQTGIYRLDKQECPTR